MVQIVAPTKKSELEELLNRDHTLHGCILHGLEGFVIEVQARAMSISRTSAPWDRSVRITGMAKQTISEAMDRIRGAFRKLRIPDPNVEILINLLPPDVPKESTSLDLPLAIIMLQAAGMLPDLHEEREDDFIIMGEVGLHAEVRRVPGVLSMAYGAKKGQSLLVPSGNEKEAALVLAKPGHEGCKVYPVSALGDAIEFFQGKRKLENALKGGISFESFIPKAPDLGVVRGQERAKEALILAAAGGHNLLLVGPPGVGKSLLTSCMPGILPQLSDEEKVELTKIYSATGALNKDGAAVTRRPMRAIHHSASKQALVGGGSGLAKPGEITLSHLGVLFLDEIAEFAAGTLDALRQPMETGEITIARTRGSMTFPCRFTLVAAMNPCPCGYAGTVKCRCSGPVIDRYQRKISGPILDRIDLKVEMEDLSIEEKVSSADTDVSARVRRSVQKARELQLRRAERTGAAFNAAIPGGRVLELAEFTADAIQAFRSRLEPSASSMRASDRVARVSRTVADLEGASQVEPRHVNKAASFVLGGVLGNHF